MGKKSSGKTYTSKGQVGTNKSLSNSIRAERHPADVALNKLKAFSQGKNVFFTIDNPNPKETNKRRIRVNAKELIGDYRVWNGQRKK